MRRIFRLLFLVVLGLVIGLIGYEGIMFVRVLMLRNGNPSSTSLIDTRIKGSQIGLVATAVMTTPVTSTTATQRFNIR